MHRIKLGFDCAFDIKTQMCQNGPVLSLPSTGCSSCAMDTTKTGNLFILLAHLVATVTCGNLQLGMQEEQMVKD